MYKGIELLNNGKVVDLNSLEKNSEGQLLLEGLDFLKITLEDGAKYDENVKLLENDSDTLISLVDSSGEKIEVVLLGLSEVLLKNNGEIPILEVFEGVEKIASMITIDDLEAAAAGGTLSSTQTSDFDDETNEQDQNAIAQSGGNLDGFERDTENEATEPTVSEEEVVTIEGDLSASITEDFGLNNESVLRGIITNTSSTVESYSFVPQSTETEYGIFTLDENGNWSYDLFSEELQELEQNENLFENFVIELDGSDETAELKIDIVGLNDVPVVEAIAVNTLENDLEDQDSVENTIYKGQLEATDAEGDTLSFTKSGTVSLILSTEEPRLVSALNSATADLDYVKSVLSEMIAIPEIQNVLNDFDISDLESATSVSDALTIVLGALGISSASLTEDGYGVQLNIPDASPLEESGILNIDINTNGEYTVTSPLFNHLSTEGSVKLAFDFIVDDGISAATQTVSLEVSGSNDAPILDEGSNSVSVNEDATVGTVITTVGASDVDISNNLIFSVDDPSGKFTINPLTGELTLIAELDYEMQEEYSVDVKVADSSGAEDVKTIQIKVNDILEQEEQEDEEEPETPVLTVASISEEIEENDLEDTALITGASTDTTYQGQIENTNDDNVSYARAGVIGLTINTSNIELLTAFNSLQIDLSNVQSALSQVVQLPEVSALLSSNQDVNTQTLISQLQSATSIDAALTIVTDTLGTLLAPISADLNGVKAILTQIVSVPEINTLLTTNLGAVELQGMLGQLQLASSVQETLSITSQLLDSALNPITDDLSYIRSIVSEIVAIPEVAVALANNLNSNPNMDLPTLLAQVSSSGSILEALELLTESLGLSGVELVPTATGLSLVIPDSTALEDQGLLNVEVNSNGSYTITSPLFNYLGVDDNVEITFDYSADDGVDTLTETVTLEVLGNNDFPNAQLVDNEEEQVLNISGTDPDILDSGIIDMAELLANTEGLNTSEVDEINVLQGNHILSNITVEDVLSITDSDNTLEINGDAGDKLLLNLGSEVSDASEVSSGDVQWHKDTSASTAIEEVYVGKTSTDETITLLINGINVEDI